MVKCRQSDMQRAPHLHARQPRAKRRRRLLQGRRLTAGRQGLRKLLRLPRWLLARRELLQLLLLRLLTRRLLLLLLLLLLSRSVLHGTARRHRFSIARLRP